eukprot:CAMPEP_0201284902 /NCGR_PEP_ID=MMETSP1317-20130820/88636_1 /ASSEMBLY_ACC=CAM_ASM_000770 /TAXON_ID=187299 /ORGANISM="Undescribed Undescribed, Strain Undescribed" /LENGTH=77 /DNA_ID=CAMNT_0047607033 /DNA_START=610 /DNA_END=843 /DNA_ORIENTATION=-
MEDYVIEYGGIPERITEYPLLVTDVESELVLIENGEYAAYITDLAKADTQAHNCDLYVIPEQLAQLRSSFFFGPAFN